MKQFAKIIFAWQLYHNFNVTFTKLKHKMFSKSHSPSGSDNGAYLHPDWCFVLTLHLLETYMIRKDNWNPSLALLWWLVDCDHHWFSQTLPRRCYFWWSQFFKVILSFSFCLIFQTKQILLLICSKIFCCSLYNTRP